MSSRVGAADSGRWWAVQDIARTFGLAVACSGGAIVYGGSLRTGLALLAVGALSLFVTLRADGRATRRTATPHDGDTVFLGGDTVFLGGDTVPLTREQPLVANERPTLRSSDRSARRPHAAHRARPLRPSHKSARPRDGNSRSFAATRQGVAHVAKEPSRR